MNHRVPLPPCGSGSSEVVNDPASRETMLSATLMLG
jgi:hypothetical protein